MPRAAPALAAISSFSVVMVMDGLPGSKLHVEWPRGAQIDQRLEFRRRIVDTSQGEAPREAVQVHQHLVDGQCFADAMVSAGREGQIGQAWPGIHRLAFETFGHEALRFVPELRMAVYEIGAEKHVGVRWHGVAAERVGLDGPSRYHPH